MNLNIDRLHKEDKERGEGRTVEVLIKALQNSSFYDNDVAIVAHTKRWAGELCTVACDLAWSMDGYAAGRHGKYELVVNGVHYFFLCKSELERFKRGRRSLVVFFDNSVGSCIEILKRARESVKKFTDGLEHLDDSVRTTDKKMRLIRDVPKSKNREKA